ncbi:hypothetical protein L3V82_04375 [Thiotrichales bacterium 19S3-7]|nr:hypothetical protein [Thiotrichales bacterium 19S3-7]MCF6801330.1 hypothetical protein [Thiotrichales bacterium 19S3-11]
MNQCDITYFINLPFKLFSVNQEVVDFSIKDTDEGNHHFHILAKLGSGAIGHTFLVKDLENNKQYALKIAEYNSENVANYSPRSYAENERKNLKLMKLTDFDSITFKQFRIEYSISLYPYYGQSLEKYLSEAKLDDNARIDLSIKVAQAVANFHKKGYIHFDLKPANMGINKQGEVNLFDFDRAQSQNLEGVNFPDCGNYKYYSVPSEIIKKKELWAVYDICALLKIIEEINSKSAVKENQIFNNLLHATGDKRLELSAQVIVDKLTQIKAAMPKESQTTYQSSAESLEVKARTTPQLDLQTTYQSSSSSFEVEVRTPQQESQTMYQSSSASREGAPKASNPLKIFCCCFEEPSDSTLNRSIQ